MKCYCAIVVQNRNLTEYLGLQFREGILKSEFTVIFDFSYYNMLPFVLGLINLCAFPVELYHVCPSTVFDLFENLSFEKKKILHRKGKT